MADFKLKVEIKELPIEQIFENVGQIPDVPENPRTIKDEDFELLKKSIIESPEMKNLDEVKVYPYKGSYIAIGGNHRLRAYKELEWKSVLCKVLPKDTPKEKLCEYIMKENMQYASNDPYKLQLQERLAQDIIAMLDEALEGKHQGMAIVMKGTHLCKTMRGARANGQMTVSHVSGIFKTDANARREFYKLIDLQ